MHIDFPDSREQFRDNLLAAFPGDAAVVDAYLEEVKSVGKTMRAYYLSRLLPPRFLRRSAMRFLRARRSVTCINAPAMFWRASERRKNWRPCFRPSGGYYGSPPQRSSFAIHALVAKHFMFGATYPVGGSKNIAATLMRTIAANGGWTRISAPVEEILVRGDRAASACAS